MRNPIIGSPACVTLCVCVVSWCLAAAHLEEASGSQTAAVRPASSESFDTNLARMSSAPADACADAVDDADRLRRIFDAAAQVVVDELNRAPTVVAAGPDNSVRDRASAAIQRLTQSSARINESWPGTSRFRAELVDVPPVVIMKAALRERWALYAFAPSAAEGGGSAHWRIVKAPDADSAPDSSQSLEVFPIQRGPSHRPRFLMKTVGGGCAGSFTISYQLFEWDPREPGDVSALVTIHGALTQEESGTKSAFPPIGTLQTNGPLISLPYCWFSVVDTWDNPSLCAADSFDVAEDRVRFRSRTTNRPDLVPIAQAIKHAQARDYPAVRAYCRSEAVARAILREIPAYIFTGTLRVHRVSDGTEIVQFGLDEAYRFQVERGPSGWAIAGFRIARRPSP